MIKDKPLYRRILGQAFIISWRNKFLWFFGLFVAMLGGGGGEYDLLISGFSRTAGEKPLTLGMLDVAQDLGSTGFFQPQTLVNLRSILLESPFSLFMATLVFGIIVAIAIFIIWLIIVSQVALINATKKIQAGEVAELQMEIEGARGYFWPVFILDLMNKFLIWALLVLAGIVVFVSATKASVLTLFLFIFAFVVFISLVLIISFIVKYAICYVVLKKQRWHEALRSAVNLFFDNWVISLEMALVLFVIDAAVKIIFISLALLVAAPVAVIGMMALFLNLKISFWLTIILPLLLLIVLILVIAGSLTSFQYCSWTLLFMDLVSKKTLTSKITRLAGNISTKITGKLTDNT